MRFIAIALTVASVAGEVWWGEAVYYRILIDSFKDSDGDGLGDLLGAGKQMSYVRALGADAIILSPVHRKSTDCDLPGNVDLGQIDPRYGDLDQLASLLSKAKKLDDGIEWIWSEERNASYASKNKEALLNLCSESTIAALSEVQCIWLKRGVAGVVLQVDQPHDFDCSLRLVKSLSVDAISCAHAANLDTPVIVLETALDAATTSKYFENGATGVISEALTALPRWNSAGLAVTLHAAVLYSPQEGPVWTTSVTGGNRIASRYGSNFVDAINLLTLILPGSAIIQQGDELGVADTLLEWDTRTDCWPAKKYPSSAPFPWDDSPGAGFSTGQPWLPLPPNYRYANAKTEFANDASHLGVLRVAAATRKSPAMGPHAEIRRLGEAIAILRWGGTGSLLVVANLGRGLTHVQISKIPGLPTVMTVAASSGGSSWSSGLHVNVEKGVKLNVGESLLLAGPPRHCGGPGPVDKIANKLSEGWQKINKYFSGI